jgi:hypothetical protein
MKAWQEAVQEWLKAQTKISYSDGIRKFIGC